MIISILWLEKTGERFCTLAGKNSVGYIEFQVSEKVFLMLFTKFD